MTSPHTATDVVRSLTGYDELAIAKHYGADVVELQERPLMFLRALMFVMERRGGAKDAEAYRIAMSATGAEVNDYFPDDPAHNDDPESPTTELGKDAAAST